MTKERKAFNFFKSYFDVYHELSDKEKVKFMDALLQRQFWGVEPSNLGGMSNFAYISQKHSIDAQVKGYEDKTGYPLQPPNAPPTEGATIPPSVQVEEEGKEKEKEEVKGKEQKVYSKEVHDTFQKCLNYFPEHLHPNTEAKKNNWLDTLHKLNTLDNLDLDLIRKIVKKTRADDFWSKNFLSLTKLRKSNKDDIKFITVFYEKFKTGNKSSSNNIDPQDMQDYLREQQARTS